MEKRKIYTMIKMIIGLNKQSKVNFLCLKQHCNSFLLKCNNHASRSRTSKNVNHSYKYIFFVMNILTEINNDSAQLPKNYEVAQ